MNTRYCIHSSPIGPLLLAGRGDTVIAIRFAENGQPAAPDPDWIADPDAAPTLRRQLDDYFAGRLTRFELDLDAQGTAFQKSVWAALQDIPYGETWSYGQLARHLGRPTASRAVGAANGANPIPIVVPCHRVIGANGSMTGFGGGIACKQQLLALEAGGRQGGLFG